MTSVLIRKGEDTEGRQSGEDGQAENGVMWPQAKEHQEPPEAARGQGGSFPENFRGSEALLAPGSWTSGFQNCERKSKASNLFSATQFVVLRYGSPGKLLRMGSVGLKAGSKQCEPEGSISRFRGRRHLSAAGLIHSRAPCTHRAPATQLRGAAVEAGVGASELPEPSSSDFPRGGSAIGLAECKRRGLRNALW